ncbi:CatA-like O-acetyltransferase [Chloroflexota bacterium]
MRVIDLDNWPRREHFRLYNGMDFPHVSICVQVDITALWASRAQADASPTLALVYVVTKAAQRVPELRQRIRGKELVEHEIIHPLITVLGNNDLFGVVALSYDDNFRTFTANAAEPLAKAKENASLTDFPHNQDGDFPRDDLLSITLLPWLRFTAFSITRKPQMDTIPLLGLGQVHQDGQRYLLPFFINFHHALADGLHIARYVKYIQEAAQELAGSFI